MCRDKVVVRQQPKSRIPIPRGARRNSRNEQAPSQAPPRSSSSQDGASTQATAKKVREATIAASPAARMRSSPPSTKVPSSSRPTSTRGTGEQGYHEMTKPFLKLVGMIEEMEAKIVGLQTSNTQQAKELADLRSKNKRLEHDHVKLEKALEGFSTMVLAHSEVASKTITQCHDMAIKTDNRLEDYMDSLERMADRVGSKFHNLNSRTTKVQEDVRAVDDKSSAKLDELAKVLEELLSSQRETTFSATSTPLHLDRTAVSAPAVEISAPIAFPETSSALGNGQEGNEGAGMEFLLPSTTTSDVPNAAVGDCDDFDDARRRSLDVGGVTDGCPAPTTKKLSHLSYNAASNDSAKFPTPPVILRSSPLSLYSDATTTCCRKGMESKHDVAVAVKTAGD